MKKLPLFAVCAIFALMLSGCASDNSDTVTEYSTDSFKFSLNDSFVLSSDDAYDEDDITFTYKNNNNVVYVSEFDNLNRTLEVYCEGLAADFESDDEYQSVVFEPYDDSSLDAYVIHLVSAEQKSLDYYILNAQNKNVTVVASFEDKYNEKLVPILNEMLNSFEYTSDYYFPTAAQTFQNQYFSIQYAPQWVAEANGTDDSGVQIKYAAADEEQKSYTYFFVEPQIDSEFSSFDEMADSAYQEYADSTSITSLEMAQTDFLGMDSVIITYNLDFGTINSRNANYYFQYNNVLYCVRYLVPLNDNGDVQAEIDELINSLNFDTVVQ